LIYVIFLILLLSVEFFGIENIRANRWINLYFFNLQPSELVKIGLIIFLARYYNRLPSRHVSKIKYSLLPFLALFFPVSLVLSQPDLGTAILIATGGILVIWFAGYKIKYFVYLFLTSLFLAPVIIAFLKPYQKLRILTFFNPERDPLGAGYQIIQSKIAVGSGGLFGKGFLQGSQSYLDYLPEKHTDFIFTLFSEEFGFLGSTSLLIIYTWIIYRIIKIGKDSKNNFSFGSAFFVYVVVNMCTVLGLLPIVGSPLPIMSYGGSAMLAIMLGFSIVMSCKIYKDQNIN
jgi:rod shape determining protein RodA